MAAELTTIAVRSNDPRATAEFVARILNLPLSPAGRLVIPTRRTGEVTIDFVDVAGPVRPHHVLLVSEDEFDAAYGRILDARAAMWADASRTRPTEIAHDNGGRGVFVETPDGNLVGIITRAPTEGRETR